MPKVEDQFDSGGVVHRGVCDECAAGGDRSRNKGDAQGKRDTRKLSDGAGRNPEGRMGGERMDSCVPRVPEGGGRVWGPNQRKTLLP